MGAKGEMRRLPSALSCFGGSSVTDEMPDEVESRRRSARSLSWSRSRAKKKQTVPLDCEKGVDNEQKMDVPSATKKGLFQKFRKDKSNKQLQNQQRYTTSYKSPTCHATSKCDTQTQTVTLFQEPVLAAQMKIKSDRTGSPTKPNPSPTVSKVQNKKKMKEKKKKKKDGEMDMGVALTVLAMTLVTMLLGGRSLAILFMSVGFYTLPYFSTTAMSPKRNKTYSIEVYQSLEQYNVKIVLQDLASMLRKISRSTISGFI